MDHFRLHFGGGADKYPAKAHARRVADKLRLVKGIIVLEASKFQLYPDSDQPLPFRQDRYFYYLSGCPEANCYVTYHIAADHLTLWLPEINQARVVWNGRGSTVEEAMDKYDIDEAQYTHSAGVKDLDVSNFTTSYHGQIQRASNEYIYRSHVCLKHALDACRVIKDEYEIGLITRANDISAAAHAAVLQNLHNFTNEAEVEAVYMQVCIAKHAKEQAYAPIVGAGANGSILHYDDNDQDFKDGQTMVIDAGCEVSCYASDVTRTLPLNSKSPGRWPSKEAKRVYGLVEKMQEECIKCMLPGTKFVEIAQMARHMAVDGLLELGVLEGDHDDIFAAGTETGFFPHGLGHHLGLEVHDVAPDPAPPARSDRDGAASSTESWFQSCEASAQVLQPGMVVTIEPGIYFNEFLLRTYFLDNPKHSSFINKEVLARYMAVGGVRIEDDILVTKTGYRNLTTAPKGEKMLQIIRDAANLVEALDKNHQGPMRFL